MKVHRALLGFAFATGLVMGGTLSTSASTGGSAPPDEATGSTETASYDVDAVGTCDGGPMNMWERTGGNAAMVDALVAAWNAGEPRPQDQPDLHPARRDGAASSRRRSPPATCPT